MTRCARDRRVFFFEEPVFKPDIEPHLHIDRSAAVTVVVPELPEGIAAPDAVQRGLLDGLLDSERIGDFVAWYYTPMALSISDHLAPVAIVYDCMDELSAFKNAPPILSVREQELMSKAGLVLTGGQSLYEAKKHRHHNIHPFPSSVDAAHFAKARQIDHDPADQEPLPHPRLGFFGVIDERMDLALLEGVAAARPDWHLVLLGPVVKIDPASLPHRANIHYLGSKSYAELPQYLSGWEVAILPFARNDATRFISPTKTPEYMAAGKPVVSTSIRDVVRPYGQQGLVRIADDVQSFVRACTAAMAEDAVKRVTRGDAFLRQTSWDGTWARIRHLMDDLVAHATADDDSHQPAEDATAV